MTSEPGPSDPLPAGSFSEWLRGMRGALDGTEESDVPCGDCTACCQSSQFIHVEPDEIGALARIPRELQFPAPGLPAGNVVLGYDDQGRCPMLHETGCSIYESRPRACRTYDCRIFAATGIEIDDPTKALVNERVLRWRFSFATASDQRARDAVRTAAAHLERSAVSSGPGTFRPTAVELAVRTVRSVEL